MKHCQKSKKIGKLGFSLFCFFLVFYGFLWFILVFYGFFFKRVLMPQKRFNIVRKAKKSKNQELPFSSFLWFHMVFYGFLWFFFKRVLMPHKRFNIVRKAKKSENQDFHFSGFLWFLFMVFFFFLKRFNASEWIKHCQNRKKIGKLESSLFWFFMFFYGFFFFYFFVFLLFFFFFFFFFFKRFNISEWIKHCQNRKKIEKLGSSLFCFFMVSYGFLWFFMVFF